jgi:surface antigen
MQMRCTDPLMSSLEEATMSPSLKVVMPVVAGFMIASAQAQLLPTWETHITLTQQDLDMIHGAVTNQVHGKPAGTAASWINPASGNSGSIRLVKKLARKNQQCEDIEYTVRSGGQPIYAEHYRLTSCLGRCSKRVFSIIGDHYRWADRYFPTCRSTPTASAPVR